MYMYTDIYAKTHTYKYTHRHKQVCAKKKDHKIFMYKLTNIWFY